MILSVDNIDVFYGQSQVLRDVALSMPTGKIGAVLGRNGMGKTTLLKAIMGLTPPRSGQISFKGQRISGLAPFAVARHGIAYVPQGREIFAQLSVRENLAVGTIMQSGKIAPIPKEIFDYFPILQQRIEQKGGTLSGGEQQMLAFGRAIAGAPDLLLLDEPTEGIQPSIVQNLKEVIRHLNAERKLSILLVEQNTEFAFDLADYCYVIEKGQICSSGSVDEIRNDEVIRRYLTV